MSAPNVFGMVRSFASEELKHRRSLALPDQARPIRVCLPNDYHRDDFHQGEAHCA
jgi:hypothetical protein